MKLFARDRASHPGLRAAGWMLVSIASFVLMTVAARQLTGRMITFEILFWRSLVALAILLAVRPRLAPDAYATRRPFTSHATWPCS